MFCLPTDILILPGYHVEGSAGIYSNSLGPQEGGRDVVCVAMDYQAGTSSAKRSQSAHETMQLHHPGIVSSAEICFHRPL